MLAFSDHEPHMVAASFKPLCRVHLERLFGVRQLHQRRACQEIDPSTTTNPGEEMGFFYVLRL